MNNFYRSLIFVCVGLLFDGAVCYFAPNSFKNSYQAAIVRQYDYYRNIKEQGKIVVIGGSSVAFGIDLDALTAKTGRSCAELGVHAGMGISFVIEASKRYLNPGDVVVVEFPDGLGIDTFDPELILTGIGHRADMYRLILPRYRLKIVSQYPRYIMKRYCYSIFTYSDNGYKGSNFDDRGCLTILREGNQANLETYTKREWTFQNPDDVSQDILNYLNDYVNYCKTKNVDVFFTYSPFFDEAWDWNKADIKRFDEVLSSKLNAPLITSLKDAIYPREYVWDVPRHLNSQGAKIRSERLAEALKPYLESE